MSGSTRVSCRVSVIPFFQRLLGGMRISRGFDAGPPSQTILRVFRLGRWSLGILIFLGAVRGTSVVIQLESLRVHTGDGENRQRKAN